MLDLVVDWRVGLELFVDWGGGGEGVVRVSGRLMDWVLTSG